MNVCFWPIAASESLTLATHPMQLVVRPDANNGD